MLNTFISGCRQAASSETVHRQTNCHFVCDSFVGPSFVILTESSSVVRPHVR